MVRLKSVGILSYGYVTGILSGILGFLVVLFTFPAVRTLLQLAQETDFPSQDLGLISVIAGWGLAVGLILIPVFSALYGFIGGCIFSLLYNLIAKWTGGVELEFVKKPPTIYKKPPKKHAAKSSASPVEKADESISGNVDTPTMILEEEPIVVHQEKEK